MKIDGMAILYIAPGVGFTTEFGNARLFQNFVTSQTLYDIN
jgi:hypothetical protein